MIPRQMEAFLRERLPERTWRNRLRQEGDLAFMEFGPLDVDRLARLGIEVDSLGPHLVVCMWDQGTDLEVGGYLVVDNLAMGRPSMGGIRMLPDLTPATVYNLARGMTLKNAAAMLPYGGGKSGIVAPDPLEDGDRQEVIRRFAHLIYRYHDIYLPGPDVGTNDGDMKTIAIENGIDNALSKPLELGGNRIDELGAAAGGLVIAIETLLEEMPRLRSLPQFANLSIPRELTVLIQGFGAVGAHAARMLRERIPGAKVVGISDAQGYLYDPQGLPVDELFDRWVDAGLVTRAFYEEHLRFASPKGTKFGSDPDDLLRESAFCFIPAAPVANYLDTEAATRPSMTTERMGRWSLIVEGANTYSPDPARKMARGRMEREVYRQRGILIATDYLVNSGGVIFAAQERLLKTPPNLRFPQAILGDAAKVEAWLQEHAEALRRLGEQRRIAGEKARDEVIRRNMQELIDLLISDPDMLPCEAAERISVRRIASSESDRTAAEIMEPIPTLSSTGTVRQAAQTLVETGSPILAVVDKEGKLAGVITEWDITRATATAFSDDLPLEEIMTRKVITVSPSDGILEIVRKLEHYEISAMPVVDGQQVLGLVSGDMLARKSLPKLLQTQLE